MALAQEDVEHTDTDQSDEDLVRRAQRDPDEFGELYLRYAGPIHAFILPRVDRNDAVAQDLTSQVFSKAFSALPSYRPGVFRAWLYSIARNVVIDHYRRHRAAAPIEAAANVATDDPGLDEQAVAKDARRRLHAALTHLVPTQRQIVELRLLGLTGAEIAETLHLHPDAVKSAQYRAFAKLRDILGANPAADSKRTQRECP